MRVIIRGGVEDTRFEAKAKDPKKLLRSPVQGQGQGQTLSRPRTKDTDKSVVQKKSLHKFFFRRSLLEETKKKVFADFLQGFWCFPRNFNGSKIMLSSSRGQDNFRGLKASRPRSRTSKFVLEDALEAKDVLKDSTSGSNFTFLTLSLHPHTRNLVVIQILFKLKKKWQDCDK